MEEADGYIADPQRCYQGNYYYIFPTLTLSGDLAKGMSSQMVLVTNTRGLNLVDAERDTISSSSFMTTTDSAYAVTEDSQTQGTYTLGAVATEQISADTKDENKDEATEAAEDDTQSKDTSDTAKESAKESRLTVITAGSLIDSQITDTFTQLENTTLFMNAVSSNFDGVQNISIEPKSLATEYNTVQHAGTHRPAANPRLSAPALPSAGSFDCLSWDAKVE